MVCKHCGFCADERVSLLTDDFCSEYLRVTKQQLVVSGIIVKGLGLLESRFFVQSQPQTEILRSFGVRTHGLPLQSMHSVSISAGFVDGYLLMPIS